MPGFSQSLPMPKQPQNQNPAATMNTPQTIFPLSRSRDASQQNGFKSSNEVRKARRLSKLPWVNVTQFCSMRSFLALDDLSCHERGTIKHANIRASQP